MNDGVIVLGILFITIVMPLFLTFHYRTRWKAMNGPTQADQQELAALRDAARWMEQRIDNLERVLDTEAPGWRTRSTSK